jgi:hypothetical protein
MQWTGLIEDRQLRRMSVLLSRPGADKATVAFVELALLFVSILKPLKGME